MFAARINSNAAFDRANNAHDPVGQGATIQSHSTRIGHAHQHRPG
jgi:hypothetical protein